MEVYTFILIIFSSSCFSAYADTDEEVSCVYLGDCVLQCSFTPGSDLDSPYIQWIKTKEGLTVHSFHHSQNQELDQYPDYTGRTSLFEEEIKSGNASLLLKQVTVKDQGRYLCWANGQVTFVNMKVFAPVSKVDMYLTDDKLICQADLIYPQPAVTWTMTPEPATKPITSILPSETGLFSVESSVPLPLLPYQYSCNVSTAYNWQSRTKSDNGWMFGYLPSIFAGIFLGLSVAFFVFARRHINAFQSIYSKFEEKWKKTTDTSGDETVDGPSPEEEHLGPDNPEETETEL